MEVERVEEAIEATAFALQASAAANTDGVAPALPIVPVVVAAAAGRAVVAIEVTGFALQASAAANMVGAAPALPIVEVAAAVAAAHVPT